MAVEASNFTWGDESGRLALFPIKHSDIWDFRKTIEALHWTAQEVDLTRDRRDWDRMDDNQKLFVKMQLAFFARIDIDVLNNLDENFGDEVNCMEAKMVYAAQKDQECVHAESYSLQIEAVLDGAERDEVLNAVTTIPIIKKMREWVLKWFDKSTYSVGERLVAFAAVEGVLFSASFSALQWLRELNLLPGITAFNSFIVRDEGIHTLLTCLLVKTYLTTKPSQVRVYEIFDSVIELIAEFVNESLPVRLIGMNAELMNEYVQFQADSVLRQMGYAPRFKVANPFKFMDKLSLNEVTKTNFFEHRPTQYQNVTKPGQSMFAIDTSDY